MKKLLFNIILVALFNLSFAQTVTTSVQLDTNIILIGQQTNLNISIDYNVDSGAVKIDFPTLTDTIITEIEVVSKSVLDTLIPDRDEPTIFRQSQSFTITSFDSGYFVIPPFYFMVNNKVVSTDPTLLTVLTFPVDTSKAIFDIKGPITEPFSLIDWLKQNWWWVLLIILGIAAIIYAVKYFKNKPIKEIIAPPKPIIPAHIPALQKLEEIKKSKLWQAGKTKQHHSKISETLRAYIEERFVVNALENTTNEIAYSLRVKEISKEDLNKLIEVLKLADLVKFAKEKPLSDENESSLKYAFDIVNSTKIKEKIDTKDV